MGVDTDMWLSMKTTRQEMAIAAYTAIQSGTDKVMADILGQMHYGYISLRCNFENYKDNDDVWSVNIHSHTFRGGIPFEEAARHLLDTYPDFELHGTIENDCHSFHEYDIIVDEHADIYSFTVEPEDWDAFLAGDYANTTQGRKEIERRKKEGEPEPEWPTQPTTVADANNDEDLPF